MCIPQVQIFSVVTTGTVLRWIHSPLTMWVPSRVVAFLRRVICEVYDLIFGNQIWAGVAVAIKTPAHTERLSLRDHFHLVDAAMARNAIHALSNVNRVIEVRMLRQHVHFDPFNGFS